MPKLLDHDARRIEVAQAVWRVIRRDGLARASVRRVAREAGLSPGSLRHVFSTQSELLAFSMRLVSDRVRARLEGLRPSGDARRDVEAVILELLPLDDERRAEAEVWLAFAGQALVDARLGALRDEVDDALHGLFRQLVDALAEAGELAAGASRHLEAERLNAVVDGLVVHALLRPARVGPGVQREVVAAHLDGLAGP
jgi:AcrR family transcriptional regulator